MPGTIKQYYLSLFFGILCGFAFFGIAQESTRTLSIITVLGELEKAHEIKFSYADSDLQNIEIQLPPNLTLSQVLEEIKRQTQLNFTRISDRYYSLSNNPLISVCATVLDNFENNTLAGASVEVLGGNSTITGADGMFQLQNIPREATLRIRFMGYRTLYLKAHELARRDPCVTLLMAVRYQQLEEVVVYKFLTTGLSKSQDGSIQMSADEFGILPGLTEPDVLHSIQALPGIKSLDETVSNLNIRGGTNDQNLLLWDGIKMYQSGHFFGLISAFNPYLTDKIDIIKNGSSARYGEGVSGIISMHSQDEIQPVFFGGAGFNLINADLYGHFPLNDQMAVQVSGRRAITDFLNTPTYTQFYDKAFQDTEVLNSSGSDIQPERESDFYFYDLSAKFMYDINDIHKLRLNFIHIKNDLRFSETNPSNARTNYSNLEQTNLSFGSTLSSSWTDTWHSELTAYHTKYNLDADVITANGTQQLYQNNHIIENAVKLHGRYTPNKTLSALVGYQLIETGAYNEANVVFPNFLSRSNDVLLAHGLFGELKYESNNGNLFAVAGGRLNYLNNLNTFKEWRLEPRLSLYYKLSQHLRWEILGEMKNQTSHQLIDLEQNFLGVEKRRWVLSNGDDIPIAKSRQISTGFHFDRGHWLTGLEVFYKEVDGISTETQGFLNEDQFNGEIGRYAVKGLEYLINYKSEMLSSWLSYTLNKNEYAFDSLDPSEFPNNLDVRHNITFGTNYTYDHLKFGIGINFRSGKPFTEPLEGANGVDTSFFPARINFQPANSSRLPEYFRADASVIYNFRLSDRIRATAGASVLNLTGRKNIINRYYQLNSQDEIELVESYSLGFTPNLSFHIHF